MRCVNTGESVIRYTSNRYFYRQLRRTDSVQHHPAAAPSKNPGGPLTQFHLSSHLPRNVPEACPARSSSRGLGCRRYRSVAQRTHRRESLVHSPATHPAGHQAAGQLTFRLTSELRPHPGVVRHGIQPAIQKTSTLVSRGESAFSDPLVVTSDGLILDGTRDGCLRGVKGESTSRA